MFLDKYSSRNYGFCKERWKMPKRLIFSGFCVTRSLVLFGCFADRCLSFFWTLCCLFFFHLRILITPVVSSNSSFKRLIITICSITRSLSYHIRMSFWVDRCILYTHPIPLSRADIRFHMSAYITLTQCILSVSGRM